MRAGRGMSLYARATLQPPHKKLELFSYENNQFARLVRETLCELELPYILRNSGKGSSCRPALLQIAGSTKVPFLVDPNTGVSMGESKDIIAYLFQTYGGSTLNPVAG
jgi:glutathione S-transferase